MFTDYLGLCSHWNFCNRSTLRENIPQSMMCYFFETRCIYKNFQFLADRTNGRAIGAVLRLSVVCNVKYCG